MANKTKKKQNINPFAVTTNKHSAKTQTNTMSALALAKAKLLV